MKMKIEETEHKTMHEGEEICFRSKERKLEFERNPAEYLIMPTSPG